MKILIREVLTRRRGFKFEYQRVAPKDTIDSMVMDLESAIWKGAAQDELPNLSATER